MTPNTVWHVAGSLPTDRARRYDHPVIVLGQRFSDALCFANALHAGQTRKVSGVPYISHLLAVTSLVIENNGTEDECIAALLHDAAEDCGGLRTLHRIRDRFGETVADIVHGCSDTIEMPKPPWRERKEHHLARLAVAGRSIKLVSIADKVHNLRTSLHGYAMYGDPFWSNFSGGRSGMLWYFSELLHVFEASDLPLPLITELKQTLLQLHDRLGTRGSVELQSHRTVPPKP